MQNFETTSTPRALPAWEPGTFIRITRLMVLGLMFGCVCVSSFSVAQQPSDPTTTDLIPYRKGNQWGFSNAQKNLIIPPRYSGLDRS